MLGVPLVFFISILSYYGSNLRLDKANMLSRSANNKLRKQKCSALFKLSKKSTQKYQLQTIHGNLFSLENESGLKINAEDNFKNIALRLALQFSKLIFVNLIDIHEAINQIFKKNFAGLDLIVQQTYQKLKKSWKTQFMSEMIRRSYKYLEVFKKTFEDDLSDEEIIYQNLIGLYDPEVIRHPQHIKSRMEIAKIIKKYAVYFENVGKKDQVSTADQSKDVVDKKDDDLHLQVQQDSPIVKNFDQNSILLNELASISQDPSIETQKLFSLAEIEGFQDIFERSNDLNLFLDHCY